MKKLQTQLYDILQTIEGTGSFIAKGKMAYPYIGLQINGYGEVGLPIHADQAKGILQKVGKQAPYGKGKETLTDTSVRNTFEVDASKLRFEGSEWATFLKKILKKVQKQLGLEDKTVEPKLYKLLVYEKGGFFLPHRDTEKEKGMFGTLILTLPSAHAGGDLWVRFGGEEQKVDFSKTKKGKIGYAAFYADCEHEIKAVTEGYRVSLVFNLLQKDKKTTISSPEFGQQTQKLAAFLKTHISEFDEKPKAVLLGHQYTPTNFETKTLKGNDRSRAQALIAAADKAGFYASLGLVTLHQTGEPDYDYSQRSNKRRRYSYEDEDEDYSDAPMGEIHDTELGIEHWGAGAAPGLGYLDLKEEDILTTFLLGEGHNPIEQDYEGFMGNYGPSLDFWYHYGAIVLWPKAKQAEMLANQPTPARMEWLNYYVEKWADKSENYPQLAKDLFLHGFAISELGTENREISSLNPIGKFLLRLNDANFLQEALPLLNKNFSKLSAPYWEELLVLYGTKPFKKVFKKVAESGEQKEVSKMMESLFLLSQHPDKATQKWVKKRTDDLPEAISQLDLTQSKMDYSYAIEKLPALPLTIIKQCLLFQAATQKNWASDMTTALTQKLDRPFVHDILAKSLQTEGLQDSKLHQGLLATATAFLKEKTAIKPAVPENWTREWVKHRRFETEWGILQAFMASPTEKVFDYTMNENYRKDMESAIRKAHADLDCKTIHSGRPYTLRITKNQASYQRELKQWEKDMGLLGELEGIF